MANINHDQLFKERLTPGLTIYSAQFRDRLLLLSIYRQWQCRRSHLLLDDPKIRQLAQPGLTRGDTPMDARLLEAIKQRRFVKIATPGSDDARYLDLLGVNAVAGNYEVEDNPFNLNGITIRADARKIEILEEFLHGTQAKLGMTGSTSNEVQLEIHVKDFMIRHPRLLGLSDLDVEALIKMKESYEQ